MAPLSIITGVDRRAAAQPRRQRATPSAAPSRRTLLACATVGNADGNGVSEGILVEARGRQRHGRGRYGGSL